MEKNRNILFWGSQILKYAMAIVIALALLCLVWLCKRYVLQIPEADFLPPVSDILMDLLKYFPRFGDFIGDIFDMLGLSQWRTATLTVSLPFELTVCFITSLVIAGLRAVNQKIKRICDSFYKQAGIFCMVTDAICSVILLFSGILFSNTLATVLYSYVSPLGYYALTFGMIALFLLLGIVTVRVNKARILFDLLLNIIVSFFCIILFAVLSVSAECLQAAAYLSIQEQIICIVGFFISLLGIVLLMADRFATAFSGTSD